MVNHIFAGEGARHEWTILQVRKRGAQSSDRRGYQDQSLGEDRLPARQGAQSAI